LFFHFYSLHDDDRDSFPKAGFMPLFVGKIRT